MCDTIVATGEATLDGITVFAKNSDRQPNEAHHLLSVPAANYPTGSRLHCTYIDIPQATHTYAVLLAKPFWIWGAEMGVNEHGLAIGNEAIFSHLPAPKEKALIGMDLLRLALERAVSARQGVEVITRLLDEYGQGGNCGFPNPMYYHNSYLLADPYEAWVLETIGPHWVAKQVHGLCTISNRPSIGVDFDLASPQVVDYAVKRGWSKSRNDFNFAQAYQDRIYTTFSASASRQSCSTSALLGQYGKITPQLAMRALRDHNDQGNPHWRPDDGLTGATVCMHVAFGPVRINQTTGSWISHLRPDAATHFATGSAAPCTSLFKPLWVDARLPDTGPQPQGQYDPDSLFWQHERLHRATLRDYPARLAQYQVERDHLEQEWTACALEMAERSSAERAAYSAACFSEAAQVEQEWLQRVVATPVQNANGRMYRQAWKGFNRQAALPVEE